LIMIDDNISVYDLMITDNNISVYLRLDDDWW
jgi:hypothetical protein